MRDDAWCNGQNVCFPRPPPMLECESQSWLRFEFLDFGMWHFLKLVMGVFSGYSGFFPSFIG